jgi:hypothetical protein
MTSAEDMSTMYIEPIPSFYNEFIDFLGENFYTMTLETYQDVMLELYKKYANGTHTDFVLADIYGSCAHISQLTQASRTKRVINEDRDYMSIQQRVWLDQVLKRLNVQ